MNVHQRKLKPNQIVYLEHHQTHLYGRVIQTVPSRHLCWLRPVALVTLNPLLPSQLEYIDLRLASDLLWPSQQFQPAIDTEAMPLLARFATTEAALEAKSATACLRNFLTQLWSERK